MMMIAVVVVMVMFVYGKERNSHAEKVVVEKPVTKSRGRSFTEVDFWQCQKLPVHRQQRVNLNGG